jgi:hypothetical protein
VSGVPNQLTPREIAAARITEKAAEARRAADDYAATHDTSQYQHSRVWVFLQRLAELLAHAAQLLLDEPEPEE